MYTISIDGISYYGFSGAGRPFTLVEAMREVYGVRSAAVYRLDGTLVVRNAGSSYEVIYAPTERRIVRRLTRRALLRKLP